MIRYTALCLFTANIEGSHKQFKLGEVYESNTEHPELESYISLGFVSKEIIEVQNKPTKPTKK